MFRPMARDQRIGKVSTVSFAKVAAEVDDLEYTAADWSDGTLASIESRLARVKATSVAARTLLAKAESDDSTDYQQAKLAHFVSEAESQIRDLQYAASYYVDADVQEAMQSLPTYRIAVAGHRDLGERTAATNAVPPIKRASELHEFLHVEPRAFVRENKGLDHSQIRTAAVAYVEERVSHVADQSLRSQVVNEFVRRVDLLTNAG